jgi:hypothetical protein
VFGPFGTKNSKSVTIGDCLLQKVFAPRSTPRAQRFLSVKTTKVETFQADLEEFLRILRVISTRGAKQPQSMQAFVVKKVFAVQSSVQSVASSLRLRFLKDQGRFFSVRFAL